MYIDIVPNRKSPPAVLLRESYRVGKSIKKRTIANITDWSQAKISALRAVLAGNIIGSEQPECGPIWAVLDMLSQISKRIGITRALGSSRMATLASLLIFARIAHQGSRLSAVRWASQHCVNEIMGLSYFDEDDLYDSLTWLGEEQQKIEDKLYKEHVKEKGIPPLLVLYDVTSSYFEGEQNELANYGYNRDGKKGKKQIVIGLLASNDGEPLSVEVFEGNTSDPSTVPNQIKKLVARFGIKEVVFVGDRGMVKANGKQACQEAQFKYITALTDSQICKLIKADVFQPSLFDQLIAEVEHAGKRLVLRRDNKTRDKEGYRREDKLNKLQVKIGERNEFIQSSGKASPESGLKKLNAWAKNHKLSSFIKLSLQDRQIILEIDEQAKEKDALLDGCYVLETDVDTAKLNTQQIDERYRDLQNVERDFRTMKTGLLDVRPIFLRNAMRTRGHVFVSMLALKITREMNKCLHEKFGTTDEKPHTVTFDDALISLARICLLYYPVGEDKMLGLPKPDKQQQTIIDALKVTLTAPKQRSENISQV